MGQNPISNVDPLGDMFGGFGYNAFPGGGFGGYVPPGGLSGPGPGGFTIPLFGFGPPASTVLPFETRDELRAYAKANGIRLGILGYLLSGNRVVKNKDETYSIDNYRDHTSTYHLKDEIADFGVVTASLIKPWDDIGESSLLTVEIKFRDGSFHSVVDRPVIGLGPLSRLAGPISQVSSGLRLVKSSFHVQFKIPRGLLNKPSKRGNAPTFKSDGTSVEIHHVGQNPNGPYKEMHWLEHRGKGIDKINHPDKSQPTKIDRNAFNTARREYWSKVFDRWPNF